jgi:hypothetical protein
MVIVETLTEDPLRRERPLAMRDARSRRDSADHHGSDKWLASG